MGGGIPGKNTRFTPYPISGDLSHPGIKLVSPVSPALAGRFFNSSTLAGESHGERSLVGYSP